MTAKLKIVELDPATWDRGNGDRADVMGDDCSLDVLLLGPQGMCCMGFAALAEGVDEADIDGRSTWRECAGTSLPARDGGRFLKVYSINDKPGLSDRDRVDALNRELADMGEDFRFALKATP